MLGAGRGLALEGDGVMNDRFWKNWRWLAWVIPVVLVVGRIAFGGGWEAVLLLFYSWFIVPVTGLLGWIPRRILRVRGHTTAPTIHAVLLSLYWSGMGWYLLSMGVAGDSGTDPSILARLIPVLSRRQEQIFNQFVLLTVVLACALAIALAFMVTPAVPGEKKKTAWSRWAVPAALVLLPVLILAVAALLE